LLTAASIGLRASIWLAAKRNSNFVKMIYKNTTEVLAMDATGLPMVAEVLDRHPHPDVWVASAGRRRRWRFSIPVWTRIEFTS
jgi:hypothetical protein